jgi:hypothetical protein
MVSGKDNVAVVPEESRTVTTAVNDPGPRVQTVPLRRPAADIVRFGGSPVADHE